jgi:hypothetical protein
MALSASRNTPAREGRSYAIGLAASTTVHLGGLVCTNAAGFLVPGQTGTGLAAIGLAEDSATCGAVAGATVARVKAGCFRFGSAAGDDAVTLARIGRTVWIVDDETVAGNDGGGTRSPAGICIDVEAGGVWVNVGPGEVQPPAGTQVRHLTVPVATLQGAGVTRLVAPFAGTLTRIQTVIAGALATGDATLTAAIGGVAVTGGAVTITQAGSAAGDVDEATPSAANAVSPGSVISLTVGGTNSNAVGAMVTLTFSV